MAEPNSRIVTAPTAWATVADVQIYAIDGQAPSSVGVKNLDASIAVDVSFSAGVKTSKKLVAGEALIWDKPGRSVWLKAASGTPSVEVFWE